MATIKSQQYIMKKKYLLSILFMFLVFGLHAQELKIASYNLRMDTPADSLNAWMYRKDNVAGLIKYHKFDIVGTQEGFKHQLDDLKQIPNFSYVGVARDDGKNEGEHSAIFYNTKKFEKLSDGTFWLSQTPEKVSFGWDAACRRVCTWVKLKDKQSGKVFFVFNTHYDHKGELARNESSKLLLSKIDEIAKGYKNIIITGDFNATPESTAINTIKSKYVSSKDISSEKPYGPSATINNRFNAYEPLKSNEIDYIFVQKNATVFNYAVVSDSKNGHYPSDHLPVTATIQLK